MSLRALLYRRPSEPAVVQVVFDKAIYLVRLRRHRQARRYTLRIDAAAREVVLTMPPRGSLKEAKEFAQKHGGWIAARLKCLPAAAPFAHGVEVPLRGEPHRIVNRRGVRGKVVEHERGRENEPPRERQYARVRARAPTARLVAHADALDGDAELGRVAAARRLEIALRLALEEIAGAAVDVRRLARNAQQPVAGFVRLGPHGAAHAAAIDDAVRLAP